MLQDLYRRPVRSLLVAGSALLLALVAACSGGGGDEAGEDAGSSLVVGYSSMGNESLDPVRISTASQMVYLDAMFDYLFTMKRDATTFTAEPSIAESAEMSDDGLTWTLKIRQGVTFHDGSALTAEDVKFSLEQYRSAEGGTNPRGAYLKTMIESMTVTAPDTIEIATSRVNENLEFDLSDVNPLPILPKAYYEKVGPQEFSAKPVGSGPYTFVSHDQGQDFTFKAYPEYWGTKATIQDLEIRLIPEEASRTAALRAGDIDAADITGQAARQLTGESSLKTVATSGATTEWISLPNYSDDPDSPLNDVRVREALNLAIDRAGIVQAVYAGAAEPSGIPFLTPGAVGFQSAWTPLPYDVARAKSLLAEAGYADGFALDLVAFPLPPSTLLPEMAEAVASQWAEIGVEATIKPAEFADVRQQLADSDAAFTFRLSALPDQSSNVMTFFSDGAFSIVRNQKIDALVDEMAAESSTARQIEKMTEILNVTYTDRLAVPVVYGQALTSIDADISTWPMYPGLGYKYTYHLIRR